jgi:hypothetical protein
LVSSSLLKALLKEDKWKVSDAQSAITTAAMDAVVTAQVARWSGRCGKYSQRNL